MKIVCDCGNEMELKPYKDSQEDESGILVQKDYEKFYLWAKDEYAGIICENCKKSIRYFA